MPLPLEGVKSRKRAIFGVEDAAVGVGGDVCRISSVKVALESRIIAAGEAGRVATDVLLGKRDLASGKAVRQAGLTVLHLGPHLAGAASATVEQHRAAVVAAWEVRPHVVVLDEGIEAGDSEWAKIFQQLLECEDIRGFRGAVIFCVSDEQPAARCFCSERWARDGDWIFQEKITGNMFEILEDVLCPGVGAEACSDKLLAAVSELSKQCFSSDAVELSEQPDNKYRWVMSLLTEAKEDGSRCLCGFMCHQHLTDTKEIRIRRLAVMTNYRKRGYGQRLMRWLLGKAKQMPESECSWISLGAVETAIPFYENFGFTDMTAGDQSDDPELNLTEMLLKNTSAVN